MLPYSFYAVNVETYSNFVQFVLTFMDFTVMPSKG